MDRLSEAGAIAGSKEPRTCPADVASPPRIAPPLLRGSRAAAGAGALPGARRRCKAGKRTHGRATRTCLALLAATALLAMAAPAQAQTEVWSATLTPGDLGGGILGCSNGVSHARCSNTSFLSEDSFNHDSTDYNIAGLFVRSSGQLEFSVDADITTATAALTLVVGSTSFVLADATSINTRSRYWSSSGVSLTAGTDITVKLTAPGTPNTAATGAPTITGTAQVGKTLTAVTTGIMDADGLTSPTYTYQWIRVDGTEAAIAGENSSTYILVDADLGTTLKVKVTFADDLGHTETLTSAATATVGATATAPSVSAVAITSDPGPDGIYAEEDVIEITVTFSETVTVDTTNGTPSLALTVGRPRKPALYSPDSASVAQRFTYTVGDSDIDTDGVSIAAGRIALNGGTIQDHADNPSLLVYEAVPTQPGHGGPAGAPGRDGAWGHADADLRRGARWGLDAGGERFHSECRGHRTAAHRDSAERKHGVRRWEIEFAIGYDLANDQQHPGTPKLPSS